MTTDAADDRTTTPHLFCPRRCAWVSGPRAPGRQNEAINRTAYEACHACAAAAAERVVTIGFGAIGRGIDRAIVEHA